MKGNNEEKKAKIAKINTFHMRQFAYFLEKMRSIKEGQGTLLDNSMIVYCSGLGDGNAHSHVNLPFILAGKGGGAFHPGRHFEPGSNTPMNNLYVTMLQNMGVKVSEFGDSTGALTGV